MNHSLFPADGESIPVISLWQPWAQWVMMGWKTIETRTHNRFAGLAGQRIGIHAAQVWDKTALEWARPWLGATQLDLTRQWWKAPTLTGALLGTVHVIECRSEYDALAVVERGWRRVGRFHCLCDLCA